MCHNRLPRCKELLVFVLPDVRLDSGMLRRMLIDLGLHGVWKIEGQLHCAGLARVSCRCAGVK